MKTMGELPQELVEEILFRLPAQSLVRFMSVSKGWCGLIRSHRFARRHHETSLKIMVTYAPKETVDNTAEQPPLAEESQPELRFVSVPYDIFLFQLTAGVVHVEEVGFPFNYKYEQILYNTCDGLFLVMNSEDHSLNIYNPSSGEWKQLPESPKDESLNDTWLDCGIGYDHITDDYKVLHFESTAEIKHGHVVVSVYTLSTNSWRRLSDDRYTPQKIAQTMAVVGNALHLFVNRTFGLDDSDLLVSFDLSTEEFREVPQPDYGGDRVFRTYLVASDSCLCVAAIQDSPRVTHVWKMQQYGVKDSWTKLASVTSEDVYALHLSMDRLLLHIFEGGVSKLVFISFGRDDNGKSSITMYGFESAQQAHNSIQVYVDNPLIRL